MNALGDLLALLKGSRFDLSCEAACQDGIEAVLREGLPGVQVIREWRMTPRDRPDFLIDGEIVLEVKASGCAKGPALRQLTRYGQDGRVAALVLATSQAIALPDIVGGKPLFVVSLGRAWL